MARELAQRIVVEGTLEAVTPIQVGGAGSGDIVDIPFARDGLGRFYIPGTGLAGALRAWCGRRFEEMPVNEIWGHQKKGHSGKGKPKSEREKGHASHIDIDDAVARIPGGRPEVWPGVSIDRYTGAAASEVLYSREVLPRGTVIPLRLSLEIEMTDHDEPAGMLRHLLAGLQDGLYLGGGKTRGTGRVRLAEGFEIRRQDWTKKRAVLKTLEQGGDKVRLEDLPEDPAPTDPGISHIEVTWEAVDPVMVAAGFDGLAVDILPLVSAVSDDEVALVLPGSAIKGALRSAAERLMRTLLDKDLTGSERFLDQVKVPLVNELFGEALTADGAGRVGAVTVDTCYSVDRIPRCTWEAITLARDDAKLRRHLDATGLDIDHAYHVKVDRWTGGAFETALFSALEPRVAWEPIRMIFDRERLEACLRDPAAVLLDLTLRELREGRVPLGFGVNRGYGTVGISEISGAPWDSDLASMADDWGEYLKGLRRPEQPEQEVVAS